jgi:hypothetical protein
MSFYNPRKWKYINVRGLGLIQGIHCPHYNSMTRGIPRRKDFRDMIRKTGGIGIAIENNCAIEFIDGRFYKVISSKSYSRAYKVYKSGGEVIAVQIRQERQLANSDPDRCLANGLSAWFVGNPKCTYKKECQEKSAPLRLNADLFFSAFSPTDWT